MKVIIKEPNKAPYTADIPNELEAIQSIVGGHIEVARFDFGLIGIINEEGKLMGLEPSGLNYYGDPLVGNVILCGEAGADFADIPERFARLIDDLYGRRS